MRANSLTNLGVALDYNVASDYDKVLVVAGLAAEIEELAPHANEIATIVANLPDVLTVQEASELVNSLSVKVTTLPAGATATSELVGTEIRLGIPAGTQGVQGIQGPKGDKGNKGDTGLTGAKGPAGATGSQGPRGFRGEDGLDGEGVVITSILNNLNKSLTINFSDGTQHTTDPLKGEDGRSVTITNVVNNANGTMLINFSDGTSHHTEDLRGPIGFKGDTGDHVHHVSYQRSKDSLGNDVGPTIPSTRGYTDTYAMWTSQEELPEMFIGEFTVYNGRDILSAEEKFKLDSAEIGAKDDQKAFEVPYDNTTSGLLSEDVQNSIDELSATKINLLEKGQPNGVAELDANGLVPSAQLPSYVDDVLEVTDYTSLPVVGESGKIYIVVEDEASGGDTSSYRWTGTVYAMVTNTMNAADIKALYESNADTNEYSDSEKLKVGHISVTQAVDLDAIESRQGTAGLDTVATNLSEAVNEVHGELDAHIADTEDAHDASAISHIPGDNTYAVGDELQTVVEQIDTELEDQDNRLDTLEDVDTVEGSVLKSIKDTAKDAIYDNTTSVLAATTLNAAIDELDNVIDIHRASTGEDHTYIDQDVTTTATPTFVGIVTEGLVDGRDVSVDGTKLDTIEVGATADQTGAEIKSLYEAELDTNAYTDASVTKLDVDIALSTIATTLPTAINELKTAVDLNTAKQTNITTDLSYTAGVTEGTIVSSDGTDAVIPAADATNAGLMLAVEKAKLGAIEDEATADQTAEEIEALYEGLTDTNKYTDVEKARVSDLSGVNTGDQTDITGNAGTVTNGVYTTDIGATVQAYNADIVIDANYIAYTQTEKDKVANLPDNTDLVLGTTTLTRFDKMLGSMGIIGMEYLNGDLVTVRYTGDDDTNVFYRDVLEYTAGDLTTVKHYYNTADLVTESGLTTLVYDIDKNLISSNYTEV